MARSPNDKVTQRLYDSLDYEVGMYGPIFQKLFTNRNSHSILFQKCRTVIWDLLITYYD